MDIGLIEQYFFKNDEIKVVKLLLTKKNHKILAISLMLGIVSPIANAADLGSLFGQSNQTKFLPVNQAFRVNANQDGNKVVIHFGITPEHYVYRDKIKLTLPEGVTAGDWKFNRSPSSEEDPIFGKVWVFDQDVTATAVLNTQNTLNGEIKIRWQGCARAGLCYPPENITLKVGLAGDAQVAQKNTQDNSQNQTEINTSKTNTIQNSTSVSNDEAATTKNPSSIHLNNPSSSTFAQKNSTPTSDVVNDGQNSSQTQNHVDTDGLDIHAQNVTNNVMTNNVTLGNSATDNRFALVHSLEATGEMNDPFGLSKNPLLAVGLLFLAGLVLAFSACVYPMIPIVTNIVAHQHKPTAFKGFVLTLSYAIGVASSYGLLGVLVAWFGRSLGVIGWLQNAWVLLGFALVFALLALYMLEVVKIRLPFTIINRLQRVSTVADARLGSVGGSFLVGLLSALVVSPCVSAPLGGALVAVAMMGNVWIGFVALFALGLGLSFPLIVMGTMQASFMPKSGEWMHGVRHFGGFLLFGVALLLMNRVFMSAWVLMLWAVWFAVFGVWLWRWRLLLLQGVGILMMGWSLCVLVGASLGNYDVWQPLQNIGQSTKNTMHNDIKITRLDELDKILMTHPKVLVDVTADWCVECRIMDKTLFTNRPNELSDFVVVKLDITETDENSRAVLERYDLFGPPALLYYQSGRIVKKQIGEVKRDEFVVALQSVR